MSGNWSDGWRENALAAADIPQTPFTMQVLNLWQQSTPTNRFTNNPLGIPALGFSAPRALGTLYAAFPTWRAFYKAFTIAVNMGHGKPLYSALATQDKLTQAWRAIHSLNWPANITETDYPAVLLDVIEATTTSKLNVDKSQDRKTVGLSSASTNAHDFVQRQNMVLYESINNIGNASDAIKAVIRRVSGNG